MPDFDKLDKAIHEKGRLSIMTLLADRKSTRLNSSHSQISYAVFCLKKKKKIRMMSKPLIDSWKESRPPVISVRVSVTAPSAADVVCEDHIRSVVRVGRWTPVGVYTL